MLITDDVEIYPSGSLKLLMFAPAYSTINSRRLSPILSHPHSATNEASPSPSPLALQQKINTIARLNLREQDVDICACQDCIYSRQLNRRQPIRLELTKHSSYKKQYHSHRKSPDMLSNSFNLETIHHNKGKPSQVIALSSYLSSFGSRPTPSPERHRPDDLLKFKGPTSSFSSYAKEYPSFKNNRSPYVKPVEPYIQKPTKMGTTIYKSQFNDPNSGPSETGKRPDNLKGGQPWTGSTTYKNIFNPPANSPSVRQSRKSNRNQTASLNPEGEYKHQYETIYRKDFLEGKKRCGRGRNSGEVNRLLSSLNI